MTKKKIDAKAPKLSLIGLIKAKGFEVSQQWEKLWSEPEIISEGIASDEYEIRVSDKYKDSVYAIIRDGKESRVVPFAEGELEVKDLKVDDKGVVIEGLEELTFSLAVVTAISDRTFPASEGKPAKVIKVGDRDLKLYVE